MIPARKSRWFNAWFAGHARGRILKSFGAVRVRGLTEARAAAAAAPLLLVANHTSWWDPLVILHLSQHVLAIDGYAMMDAKNLRRLPFFSLVGGFGVDLDSPSDGALAVRHAARLLDRPGRGVWIFPQGRERPVSERPLGFRGGSGEIARVARKAQALPVGLRYEFGASELPTLYVSFGEPMDREKDPARGKALHEQRVSAELDHIEAAVRDTSREGEGAAFVDLHVRAPSALAAAMEKLLSFLVRRHGLRLSP